MRNNSSKQQQQRCRIGVPISYGRRVVAFKGSAPTVAACCSVACARARLVPHGRSRTPQSYLQSSLVGRRERVYRPAVLYHGSVSDQCPVPVVTVRRALASE